MNPVDIDDRYDSFIVTMTIPKVKEKDILIFGEGTTLRVIATSKKTEVNLEGQSVDVKVDSAYFDRTVILPSEADFSRIRYTYFGGLLEIIVAKSN